MNTANYEPGDGGGLRVLQLAAPGEFGGLETIVAQLSVGLIRRGHTVCVGCVVDESVDTTVHPFLQQLRGSGVSVEEIKLPNRAYRKEGREIRALIRRFGADIVHTHGYRCDVIGGRQAAKHGASWVATAHGLTGGGWKNRAYERLQRRSYRAAAAVIAVSAPLAAELRSASSDPGAVHLIHNAHARRAEFASRESARAELGVDSTGTLVGWLGRLSHEKGPDVLVEAMADPEASELQVCMIGDGPLRGMLETRSGRDGVGQVHWLGAVPQAARLLKAFDVVVLSSRSEGTPMVLLEAIDAGVPLVVTRVGGIPDVVGPDEAALVEADDPRALLEAILDTVSDREGALRRAANAERQLERRFNTEDWLRAHVELYSDVAHSRTVRRS